MKKKPTTRTSRQAGGKAPLYPVFVDISGKRCLVVGGGSVALRKIRTLVECGAKVRVVSPAAAAEIRRLASDGLVAWEEKKFVPRDLDGVFMAFAATDDTGKNRQIIQACKNKDVPVNAADDPEACDFFVPSVVRRRGLCVAIGTGGRSPLLAGRLRNELEGMIPEEYGEFLEILGEQREKLKKEVPDREKRKKIFEALVYSDILELLRAGKPEQVKEQIDQCLSSLQG